MHTTSCFMLTTPRLVQVGSKYLLFGGADAYQQHFTDTHCFDASSGKWKKVGVPLLYAMYELL